jgi:hypothetical protein
MSWKAGQWAHQDYEHSLGALTQISIASFQLPWATLNEHPSVPHIFVDYRDLTKTPRETTHAVYQELDLDLSPTFDDFSLSQAEKEKNYQSRFDYHMSEYDLSNELIESELANFYRKYNWPSADARTTPSNSEESV